MQTVVCKITFELAPGTSKPAASTANVAAFDEIAGTGERAMLVQPSDFAPFKVKPEVLLTGSAYAPGGAPVRHLVAGISFGELDKTIAIHGDRHFALDGTLSDTAPFTQMPLAWDRAAGGPDTSNPAGVVTGPDARPDAWGRVQLPNLLPLTAVSVSRKDVLTPVGFGPIAPMWSPRKVRLHRYAATWDPLRWADKPMPGDFDGSYFQAAPADQWLSELPVSARLSLVGMHPDVPELSTHLAPMVPVATVETGGATTALKLRCDTLLIDTDRRTATLVYRVQVPLQHPSQPGRIVVRPEREAQPAATPAPLGPLPAWARQATSAPDQTLALGALQAGSEDKASETSVLPFAEKGTLVHSAADREAAATAKATPFEEAVAMYPELAQLPPDQRERIAARFAIFAQMDVNLRATVAPQIVPDKPVLPFPAAGSAEKQGPTPEAASGPPSVKQEGSSGNAALPFRAPAPTPAGAMRLGKAMRIEMPAIHAAQASQVRADLPAETERPPPSVAAEVALPAMVWSGPPTLDLTPSPAPPPADPMPAFVPPILDATPAFTPPILDATPAFTPPRADSTPAFAPPRADSTPAFAPPILDATPAFAPPQGSVHDTLVPPPALPILPLQPIPSAASPEPKRAEPAAAEEGAPAKPAPAAEIPLPLEDYPLERVARIDAKLAQKPEERTVILEREALSDEMWDRLKAHASTTLLDEARRGKNAQNRAYDAAYVGEIESARGPIVAAEYARITVAVEQGTTDAALPEMGIPAVGVIRVQRVWLQRILGDPAVAKEARLAVKQARDAA